MLLFCNYKTFVVTSENNTKKASGGKRVMYTTHNPCWDAKNRFNLPDELDLNFASIAHLFSEENIKKLAIPKKNEEKVEQRPLVSKVRTLLSEANIEEADLIKIAASKGHYKEAKNIEEYPDDFLSRLVIPNFKKIIELIKTTKKSK